ncbi:MAG: hypothetical protein H8E47_09825 [Anaerolineales bacterium]|nr:hypothetical protein [Anaerolineales bacterium]
MIVVLLLVTIVGSVLVTWLLPMAFNSKPPYGLAVDIAVGTGLAVVLALLAYFVILPFINLSGALALVLSAADAIGFAAVMLWVLRRIKG